MTELLQFIERKSDAETARFLVEALSNSVPEDWRDILEPFVPVEEVLEILSDPKELTLSLKWMNQVHSESPEEAPLLTVISVEALVLEFFDMYSLARLAAVCRMGMTFGWRDQIWKERFFKLKKRWNLTRRVKCKWRQEYFKDIRPRFDGIYIGHCTVVSNLRAGISLSNPATMTIVRYRRYIRLLDEEDGVQRCLILNDAGANQSLCEELLLTTDARTHRGTGSDLRLELEHRSVASQINATRNKMRAFVFSGTWSYEETEQGPELRMEWTDVANGVFRSVMSIGHAGERDGCSSCIRWLHYDYTGASGNVDTFNLGRRRWGDGPDDETRDHFPNYYFKPISSLAHLF